MKIHQITLEEKRESLQRLLDSEDIKSNEKYGRLLTYLFDASINNKKVKESVIASECFENDSSYDPSIDSYVRVYLSKLRKKIEHYYLTTGLNDKIRISIPKGDYRLKFSNLERKTPNNFSLLKTISVFLPVLILFSIFSFFLGSKTSVENKDIIPQNDIIWKEILSSEKKTLIVMGDYYFFSYPITGDRKSYVRDVEINSVNDLNRFIEKNPAFRDQIDVIYHTYLDEHIPLCTSYILPSLIASELKYDFKLASEVQLNDLNNYNIIYVGSYKSINLLSNVIGKLNFEYEVHHPSSNIKFKDLESNKEYNYNWINDAENNVRNDYAMVIKVKGPNENSFILFLSEHDFGNLSTVKYFTNPSHIQELEKDMNHIYFEALFEVKGIERTDFTMELLHMNKLENDYTLNLNKN